MDFSSEQKGRQPPPHVVVDSFVMWVGGVDGVGVSALVFLRGGGGIACEARVSAAERDAGKPCGISGPLLLTRDLFSPRLKSGDSASSFGPVLSSPPPLL